MDFESYLVVVSLCGVNAKDELDPVSSLRNQSPRHLSNRTGGCQSFVGQLYGIATVPMCQVLWQFGSDNLVTKIETGSVVI
jgi:hypothetical protein